MTISTDRTDIPVAIVGMACRLPGAANLNEYWQLISEGRSAVGEVPADRLNRELYYHPDKGVRGKTYSTKAAVLSDRTFHRDRCPLPQDLIDSVDNTHLLMTETAAEAFRHAGYDPFQLKDRNCSVFIGHAQGSSRLGELTFRAYVDEAVALLEQTPEFQDLAPAERQAVEQQLLQDLLATIPEGAEGFRYLNCNMVAGTVAKAFGLNGSWLALNSACASSLHAMLMGARALQRGRADMVVVGGASDCKSDSLVLFSNAQTLTKDDSRPFDSGADGLIMSEGYVALVMKTLERAIADGDQIQAVVRGLGVATDGRGKSLWAPRKEGQMRAMRRAYRSGVDVSRLQYLECHATATQLGDATELETLREVLEPNFPKGKKIPITSAKANIGHALEAAGVAGMIKTILCMQHQQFPAAINIKELNTKVPWNESPFFVPMQPAPWSAPADGGPRCAAVNAFGIGGLNMHVVIDEYVGQTSEQITGGPRPVAETADDRAIAIIGLGCIAPGAAEINAFWETLQQGTDPKIEPPADRWSPLARQKAADKGIQVLGGFITDYAYDWRKHKVPPKQVLEADPLQFMFLDASEQALADAGYDRESIQRELCGVVIGTEFGGDFGDQLEMGLRLPEMQAKLTTLLQARGLAAEKIEAINQDFANVLLKKWPALVDETGSFTSSTLASRISKTLDLNGGAVAIDSGTTSGMSGIALCIDSLLSGDNDMMICAAGQRRMGITMFDGLRESGLLHCDAEPKNVLDAGYNGVVPSEGAAVVVLKRLSDARRDGDRIRAVIRGLGVATHDSPAEAMRMAVERASKIADIAPSEIQFVDIETDENNSSVSQSLSALAHEHTSPDRKQPLHLTSGTAQFGHMGGGSSLITVLKAALESQHHEVSAARELQQSTAAFNGSTASVQTATVNVKLGGRGVGAVASWSKGQAFYLMLDDGSVAPPKAIVQASTPSTAEPVQAARIVRLGAASLSELKNMVNVALADADSTFDQAEAKTFTPSDKIRLAIVADSVPALTKKLMMALPQLGNSASRQVLEQQGIFCREPLAAIPRIAFLFPGQGSQYEGMLRDLVRQSPAAAQMMSEADAAMRRLGYPIFADLAWNAPTQLGADVWKTQIAMLLADLICLAALSERGVKPDVVLGHSYGEFPALYAAGVWNLDAVIRMTRARCDGINATSLNNAGLLATTAPPEEIKQVIAACGCQAYLANYNAPDQTVIGGKLAALEQLSNALAAKSYPTRILAVPAAFHTPLMAGSSRMLQQALETADMRTPQTPFISTVDNNLTEDPVRIRRNLGVQLTTPVKYAPLIEQLALETPTIFVEVGPQQTLTKLNRRILSGDATVIASDNPKHGGIEPILCVEALLECLGVRAPVVSTPKPVPAKTATETRATFTAPQPAAAAVVSQPITSSTDRAPVKPQPVASSRSSISTNEKNQMDDIPHFDATERRRAKMRGSAQASPPAASPPTPAPAVVTPPAPAPVAAPIVPRPTFAAPPAPVAVQPPAPQPAPPTPPPAPVAPAPVSAAASSKSEGVDLEKFLVNFVVEQTGYPPEVVDLDADMEADLGIDSIKKAQLFGELQEYFDISTSATDLSLDDFPTLRHVMDFLSASGQGSTAPAAPTPVVAPPQPVAPVAAAEPVAAASDTSPAELESFLVNFVVEQTGYPPEVVDMDADLEADLGIDSIKKAQLFGELQEYFDISTSATDMSLDDFPTLRHVLNFLSASGQASESSAAAPVATPAAVSPPPMAETPAATGTSPAELESFLVNFVVEQTGYPPEVVDMDADLEADLGIDSIKKAQLFGELQEYFDISTSATDMSLDDFPTLRHVLNFLAGNASAATEEPASFSLAAPAPALETKDNAPAAASSTNGAAATELNGKNLDFGAAAPLTLVGTPYEMGWRHGSQYRAEIRRVLRTYAEYVGESIDELPGSAHTAQALQLLTPDQLDELQGIADAIETPLSNVLAHHFAVAETLTGMEQAASTGQSEGSLLHAAQFGSPVINPMRETIRLATFLRRPTNGLSHVVVAPIGTMLVLGGVNAAGLTFSGENHSAYVLQNGVDLEAAIDLTLHSPAAAGNVVLGDLHGGRLASVQSHGQQRQVISDQPSIHCGKRQMALAGGASLTEQDVDSSEVANLLLSADSDALAFLIDFGSGQLSLKKSTTSRSMEHFSLNGLFADANITAPAVRQKGAATPLAQPHVTARFELEMCDSPLSASSMTPVFHGAAIVLGDGETAAALIEQLQQASVTVYQIADASNLESAVAQVESICAAGPAPHLFVTTARDDRANLRFSVESAWNAQQQSSMETPLFVCQKWLSLADAGGWLENTTVVAVTALGGDFGFSRGATAVQGGALTGLMKAIFIEYTVMRGGKGPRVKAFDTCSQESPCQIACNIFVELASGNQDYEVSYTGGVRRVPFAMDRPAATKAAAQLPQGVWVVTGGARGITAACALELGKRYGLKLHLIGSSELPAIDPAWRQLDEAGLQKLKAETMIAARNAGQQAPQAWERVQKSLEIDKSLRAFVDSGVSATYHACDVSDRAALAVVLEEIRRVDGPISGILHGAGIDKSCRMEKKRRDVVQATIGVKDGGVVHLAALTERDPIRHFIGFGSIAGRLGSFGQADYCLASDLLCKLMNAYRRTRPWVRAVGFHWHGWDEVGMAARPETKNVLNDKSALKLMPLAEGVGHLIREIEADVPRGEILITERRHWQRFADGLGILAESRAEAKPSAAPAEPVSTEPLGPADAAVELRTERCELKLIDSPLAAGTPTAPTFDGPVWILGENADAVELEQRLQQAGVEVYRFGARADLDETLAWLDALHPEKPAKRLFLMTSRDALSADSLSVAEIDRRRHEGIIAPYFIAQNWYKRLLKFPEAGTGDLVAATSLGGDFGFESTVQTPDGGGVAGFMKSLHIEDSRLDNRVARCKVIDAPSDESPATLFDALMRELAADQPEVEVSWSRGVRRVIRPIGTPLELGPAANIPRGGTWVVTGGARGITAIAARELAARYGWKLHLLGKSPAPLADAIWRTFDEEQLKTYKTQIAREAVAAGGSPGQAWDRVLKDCEIFNNLQRFADSGVQATYHQCDVTDRDAVAAVLEKVRRVDGPINGLMHGAGLIEPGRFDHKRRPFVEKLIRAKFDGLLHLFALTQKDPLTHCIGFGSISGRFGGNGLSDYAAGNDSMSKALDWFRSTRPDCTTLCIHWESWEGAGIATLSRFAWGPRSVMKMKYMLPEEGVRRMEEEMAGGGLKAETLYTFGDFYPMFYPNEQFPLGEFQPRSGDAVDGSFPLVATSRTEGDEFVGDVPLDPVNDPFLALHRLRGKPLMPVVVTLEALREAAELASGKKVVAFCDVDMIDGLAFHTDNAATAQARAKMVGDHVAECRWTCDFRNRTGGLIQKDRLYLQAKLELSDAPAAITADLPPFPSEWSAVTYPEDSAIYHGAPFRCLKALSCDSTGGWGHIVAQPLADLTKPERVEGWRVPSCVLDSALYACGCQLYLHSEGAISLPRKIERLELGRLPRDGENCYVHFVCRDVAEKSAIYDLTLFGENGDVILKAIGYQKVILGRGGIA
ncbi:type I polyketide synthase [Blastopirellula marina]|uniref:Probable multi-domain beta keto-acyl synthase-possibly involved in fatty acid or polyketide biosynthesis n=1 Tax=Blastopirellula marina DSM 3645 TaxID=314230 RepID=A3ZWB0_9BACT|nr:type I polyketide synthase [Blastopirellula marina]EAQ79138.1 probable multi-domain beta keto-acyl synthase-possibly involved in fatty acid or polyketide biosynthesis [Blastopirellula marina DSM 3645]